MQLTYTPCGVLEFFTRLHAKTLVDTSILGSSQSEFLKLDNGWYYFLNAENAVVDRLLKNTALGGWRIGKSAGFVCELWVHLLRMERLNDYFSDYVESHDAEDIVVFSSRHLQEEQLIFMMEICSILEVPYVIVNRS